MAWSQSNSVTLPFIAKLKPGFFAVGHTEKYPCREFQGHRTGVESWKGPGRSAIPSSEQVKQRAPKDKKCHGNGRGNQRRHTSAAEKRRYKHTRELPSPLPWEGTSGSSGEAAKRSSPQANLPGIQQDFYSQSRGDLLGAWNNPSPHPL